MVVNRAMYAIVSATAWHEPRVSAKSSDFQAFGLSSLQTFQGSGHCGYADLMASCFTPVIAIRALWSSCPYDSKKAAR
jgi:hypothetical protein